MATVTKTADKTLFFNQETQKYEEFDPLTNFIEWAMPAIEVDVTDGESTDKYRLVYTSQGQSPKRASLTNDAELFIKRSNGEWEELKGSIARKEVSYKSEFAEIVEGDVTWLTKDESYEDDLDNEILDESVETPVSFDPPQYQQKLKQGVMTTQNLFARMFGMVDGGQFEFSRNFLLNRAIEKFK